MGEAADPQATDAPRTVFQIGLAYALYPLIGTALWFVFDDGDPLRNRSPFDLLILIELATIFFALSAGYRGNGLLRTLTRVECGALALFGAVLVIGIAMAVDPVTSGERALFRLLHVGFGLSLAYLILQARPGAGAYLMQAIAAQPLLHMPMVALLLMLYSTDPMHNWLGAPVGYWHVRVWGMHIAAAISAAYGLYILAKPKREGHALWILGLVALCFLLGLSGSRGAIAGLTGGVLFALAIAPRRAALRLPALLFALIAGLALSTLVAPPIPAWGIAGGIEETMSADANEASGRRLELWAETIKIIAAHPWFGVGHDQIINHYPEKFDLVQQPHNFILQILADFGVIGASALLVVILGLLIRAFVAARAAPEHGRLAAFTLLGTFGVISLVDGVFYGPDTLAVTAMALAVLLTGRNTKEV